MPPKAAPRGRPKASGAQAKISSMLPQVKRGKRAAAAASASQSDANQTKAGSDDESDEMLSVPFDKLPPSPTRASGSRDASPKKVQPPKEDVPPPTNDWMEVDEPADSSEGPESSDDPDIAHLLSLGSKWTEYVTAFSA